MAQQDQQVSDQLHHQNNDDTKVDDFYFSALIDEPESNIFPISDSKYAEELQFQEALMSSATPHNTTNPKTTTVASSSTPQQSLVQVVLPSDDESYTEELGESSQMFCLICAETKPGDQKFSVAAKNDSNGFPCNYSFCLECIGKFVSVKLQENLNVIPCPGPDCKDLHVLEIETCRRILPREVVERWDEALCQALISSSRQFYCPFRDCSAVMIREEEEEEIAESECPVCHRLFCARCGVGPWHTGVGCDEFRLLREDERGLDDLLVRELAKKSKWKRCPKCLFFVEKTEGCLHITCRCSFQFCYGCGEPWTQTHGGCQRD